MNATDTVQTTPGVERLAKAQGVFADAVSAGLYPSLEVEGMPEMLEYSIVVKGGSDYGVLHEEIVAALRIADEHDARLWLDDREHTLAIQVVPTREETGHA